MLYIDVVYEDPSCNDNSSNEADDASSISSDDCYFGNSLQLDKSEHISGNSVC